MLARTYERPWRSADEMWPALGWSAAAFATLIQPGPWVLRAPVALAALAAGAHRAREAYAVLASRAALSGRAMQILPIEQLKALTHAPDQLFFGFGFEWQPEHSQRLLDLTKVDYKKIQLNPIAHALLRPGVRPQPPDEPGLPYLHGLERLEQPLYRPLQNFEGGTLVVGSTQTGKGVALGSLITQAIRRGDITVIIDPKNSQRLRDVVKRACEDFRGADAFLEFHPAFPERGVRLDFTFNWQKPTEIASRIQSIMPADAGGAFTAFGWDAVNVVVGGLVELERRPNLALLTKYIEGGIEPILEETLRRYYQRTLGGRWRTMPEMARVLRNAAKGVLKGQTPAASQELLALVEYYERCVGQEAREKSIDAQVRTFRHNREHYQKITANLLPILSMLTSGDLGMSLSPEPFDVDDTRPIMNYEKMERGGHVLLMCLDSLPDPSVARAIGGLALADLAARAGMRYNLGKGPRISLFIDEVSNVINRPLIEIMNKGAEGGIFTTVAMQTIADLESVLGGKEQARMALGNLNNLIAFRSRDAETQEWLSEEFGETGLQEVRVAIGTGIDTHVGDFGASAASSVSESMGPLIPPAIFGKLPNLQFFASVSGGRIFKGRFPILDPSRPPAGRAS